MRRVLLAALLVTATAGATAAPADEAAPPMSAAAFDAYTTGKTFSYEVGATPYGAEEYRPGHKVVWAFAGQECRYGSWYAAAGGQICFVYQGKTPGPQCWLFFPEAGGGLRARFVGGGDGKADLVAVRPSAGPLDCPGPAVGS